MKARLEQHYVKGLLSLWVERELFNFVHLIFAAAFFSFVELEPWHSFYWQRQICAGDGWASQIARPLLELLQPSGAVDP